MEKTSEQQVPRLDEMDEQEVAEFLDELTAKLSPEEEYELRHEDYVMEMPQSGERIRGRENMRAMQETYPGPPTMQLRRIIVRENLWVVQIASDYGGRIYHPVLVIELRDGKIWRDTRYYAEPFEAPGWRAQWVEQMESEAPDATPARDESTGERANETYEHEVRMLIEQQWEKIQAGDFASAHEWYDDAVVVEWPQSGERIRGKKNLLALRQAYPAGVRFEARRMIARQDLGVSEYVIRYDGTPVNVVAIVEFGDGKVVRETHYFADPFPPPEWRTQWVERMEAG